MGRPLREFLSVPEQERNLCWVLGALQNAVELEWATIPPYLTALWSIIDQENDDVADSLKSIVIQEMLHMGLGCNLLTTLGGQPRIADPALVPRYPGELPGEVHVGLRIPLRRISKKLVGRKFMVIEQPSERKLRWYRGRAYPTIGAFYTALATAIKSLPANKFLGTRQRTVVHGMTLRPIQTQADALKWIAVIKEQGEGTAGSPMAEGSLAHYYRFGEMFHERRYVQKDGKWDYVGDCLPMPTVRAKKVFPMAPIPAGGYPGVSDAFDETYSQVLRDLEAAWATSNDNEGQRLLDRSILTMSQELPGLARRLMQTKIGPGFPETYGPSFLYRRCRFHP